MMMELDQTVMQLIDLVKETAPHVWEMGRQKVFADAMVNLFYMVFFGSLTLLCYRVRQWGSKKFIELGGDFWDESFDRRTAAVLLGSLAMVLFCALFLFNAENFIRNVASPEYMILKSLVEMVKGE